MPGLTSIHIPKPCPVSQQALAPTEAGWHCARCQTEVIDFTRLSEAEVLAYLAGRPGQRVCAAMQVPVVPQHFKRPKGVRRWLVIPALLAGLLTKSHAAVGAVAADSLVIKGVVYNSAGSRQPQARVRVVHYPIRASSSWVIASTWTDKHGFFSLAVAPQEAADSLLIQASCGAEPRSLNYLFAADSFVNPNHKQLYIIQLKKRRIYPKVR